MKSSAVKLKKVGYSAKNKSRFTNKFWHCWTHGRNFVAEWGKNGSDGQIRTWTCCSAAQALEKMNNMISSKLAKNYTYAD